MKSIDLSDGICIGTYESYLKLKSYFQKFIHIIDYPNHKDIEEGSGNFLMLNSEEIPQSTVRELDKFAYSLEREPIFINTDDFNTGAVVALICKTTRNQNVFGSMAEIAQRIYLNTGSVPVFAQGHMNHAMKYLKNHTNRKVKHTCLLQKEQVS